MAIYLAMITLLWLATAAIMYAAVRRIELLHEESLQDHTTCIAHIASMTSTAFAAGVLERAATEWDSVEERAALSVLAREKFEQGGPSMPALWMRHRAEQIRNGESR